MSNFWKIIIIILTLISISHSLRLNKLENKIDQALIETCVYWGEIRKEEYKDTKWKDLDFYQSCIDNIRCTSPLVKCR